MVLHVIVLLRLLELVPQPLYPVMVTRSRLTAESKKPKQFSVQSVFTHLRLQYTINKAIGKYAVM